MKNTNKKFTGGYPFNLIMLFILVAFPFIGLTDETIRTTSITLNGTAEGGELSLSEYLPVYAGFASVTTTQGESAEAVLNKLADEICRSSSFNWHRPLLPRPLFVKVEGNTLTLPWTRLNYCFSGTDQGFLSVKPLLSISGKYDADKNQVSISWLNPSEQYEAIYVGDLDSIVCSSNATSCSYPVRLGKSSKSIYSIVRGRRGNSFSPPASIVIHADSQEELDTFPFYMGLAPNWSYWSDKTNAAAVKCEQGIKTDVDISVRGDPWDKPLYQLIKTTQVSAQGGVWRKFLGLTSGHTYQVEVRMNTFKMDECTNAWEFSFHIAADNPDGAGLTSEQMAGTAALPDGSKGSSAGRVIAYGPGKTTKGKWKKSSIDPIADNPESKNITLPKGVTSITVWFRHSGANSTGVGTDWIKLTDVTPAK